MKTTELVRDIPWHDSAVCVRRVAGGDPGDREIVAQGSFSEVVTAVRASQLGHLSALVISLPDRMTAPFQYVGNEIWALLKAGRPKMER